MKNVSSFVITALFVVAPARAQDMAGAAAGVPANAAGTNVEGLVTSKAGLFFSELTGEPLRMRLDYSNPLIRNIRFTRR